MKNLIIIPILLTLISCSTYDIDEGNITVPEPREIIEPTQEDPPEEIVTTVTTQDGSIQIGDVYLFSHYWDDNLDDPFREETIPDTIEILDIKGNYVKYRFDNGIVSSWKLKFVKICIRPLNK